MASKRSILALGGDGVGPEVLRAGLQVLDVVAEREGLAFDIEEDLLHGAAWDAYGTFCRDETLEKARQADAILVGAVGGPKWDDISVPGGAEMQDGLMRLRYELETFIGLRPAKAVTCLEDLLPYKPGLATGADVMVMREMCGGAFFGQPRGIEKQANGQRRGVDTTIYSEQEIARFAHAGFRIARRRRSKLASLDKANVMESGVLWRDVVSEIAHAYPDVECSHFYADNASYQLARDPKMFDVMLGDNLFGDMISDQAGAIAGSLGMLPSACLTGLPDQGIDVSGIYEPVHGTAPDIAGKGIANPIGMILSVAMMFDYSFSRPDITARIETAVVTALDSGLRTADLGGDTDMATMTAAICAAYCR